MDLVSTCDFHHADNYTTYVNIDKSLGNFLLEGSNIYSMICRSDRISRLAPKLIMYRIAWPWRMLGKRTSSIPGMNEQTYGTV